MRLPSVFPRAHEHPRETHHWHLVLTPRRKVSSVSQQRLLRVRAFLPAAGRLERGRWRIAWVLGLPTRHSLAMPPPPPATPSRRRRRPGMATGS